MQGVNNPLRRNTNSTDKQADLFPMTASKGEKNNPLDVHRDWQAEKKNALDADVDEFCEMACENQFKKLIHTGYV